MVFGNAIKFRTYPREQSLNNNLPIMVFQDAIMFIKIKIQLHASINCLITKMIARIKATIFLSVPSISQQQSIFLRIEVLELTALDEDS